MSTQKVKSFMDSPLVAWIRTFDDFSTMHGVSDLADGLVLHRVMNAVDPTRFTLTAVNKTVAGNVQARLENLTLLVARIIEFYQTSLQHLVVAALPNVTLIARDPEKHQSLDELEKLMTLLLGCVVQCDSKGPLIEKMKGMQVGHQHALVSHIQQVTETTDYVCSYDWTSFEDMSKENVEALCQAAFRHLHNVSKERDQIYKSVSELTMERDYLQSTHENGMTRADAVTPLMAKHLAGTYTPSPQMNQEILDLRGKVRNLQDQLDQKVDALADSREQLEESMVLVQKLQQEKRELFEEVHSHKLFRDEMETLQAQAAKCERLEGELQRYKQKAEDLDYLKKRVEDLKHQNDLMMETKALLEEKASSLSTRAETYDDLQAEVASLKVQMDALNQEKDIDLRRIEELIGQSARLELANKALDEKVRSLQADLEEQEEKLVNEGYSGVVGGGESSLSQEMSEADMTAKAKLIRLEKEAAECERAREELRTASAKVAELDKTNKKLYAQAHADKKTIIKLNEEVESLRVKGSRVEKLQAELSSQKERFEEVDLLRSKVKELKLRSEQAMESKAKIEDEVEMLRSKAALYEDVQADNAQLKAQYDALTSQVEEEKKRTEELLAQNAQLEVEKQTWSEGTAVMATELEQLRSRQPMALPMVISPPRISETEMAARAKLQRLEREKQQLEKTVDTLRHAQAKAEELEKANKKLHGGAHDSRREIIKLKGELQEAKSRVSRLESAQKEMKILRQQSEDTELSKKQIRELKQQINLILESKATLEDERNDLLSKLQHVSSWEEERASLRGKIEALEVEQEDSYRRVQELLESNTQLEIERDRKEREVQDVKMELKELREHPPMPTPDKTVAVGKAKIVVTENSPTDQPTEKELAMTAEAQKLRREKRELENALSTLKKNSAATQEELAKGNRRLAAELQSVKKDSIRLKEELSRAKDQKTHLTNDLVKVKEDYRKSMVFLETGDWEDKVKEDRTKETKRIEEIEARIDEAYKKTLAAKEERIAGLEKRLVEATSVNEHLHAEVAMIKKQSKLQRLNSSPLTSPMGSPSIARQEKTKSLLIESPLHAVTTVGPSELSRLKEKAQEYNRLKEQMEALKDDNQNLVAEVMEARQVMQELEASNIRLQDRSSMQDQLLRTMEEENRNLLQQVNKLLEQNQQLLMKTLESKDQYLEEEKLFQSRVGELETQRAHLHSQLESQRKEAVMRELELFKKQQKKPGILKRGIQKIKGRMSHRPPGSQSAVAIDGFSRSRSNTYNLGSSYASGTSGMPRQDSNASSDEQQSLSPSTGASEGDLNDPQLLFVPTMNSSPRTPGKASTLPRLNPGDVPYRVGEAGSARNVSDVMTLEDFLAESDKTPKSKRKYIELSKAVSTYTPPKGPGSTSYHSRASLEPRTEDIELPDFLKTGSSSRGRQPGSMPPDEGNSQASQQSQTSSRRDSDNYSITSSHSYHSSSRSSGLNQTGSFNQNFNNANPERGTFTLHPTTVTYRGRAHTMDSVDRQTGGEQPVLSKKPPRPTVTRVPVRGFHSSVALSKSKSSDELCDAAGTAGNPLGYNQVSSRKLKRTSSGDLLSSGGTPKPRRYSEMPEGVRRWASTEVLDDKSSRNRVSSLALLTNVETAEKQRVAEKGVGSCTVQLDLNDSLGPNNTAWYDYGAV